VNVNFYGPGTTPDVAGATSQQTPAAGNAKVSPAPAQEDTTTLTASSSVHQLTQAALQTFPTRSDRVAALQLAVASDQYQLDAAQTAQAIIGSV
jgi:anti-sigma28 factor (negative regulator of flagellin synthesis)